jgi:acyl-coenzyme A synthetase/AMP-(fatty) acid ligase
LSCLDKAEVAGSSPASSIDAVESGIWPHVRTELAAFKVPREIEFVSELPRNEAGKVIETRLATDAASMCLRMTGARL